MTLLKSRGDYYFRRKLLREIPVWISDGLISGAQGAEISKKYGLDAAERPSGLLAPALYMLGALLVLAGIISFLSVHWRDIHPALRITLLAAVTLGCWSYGLRQWKYTAVKRQQGHAVFTLGTLLFGADIFLIADILGLRGEFFNGFGLWAAGALVIAMLVRSGADFLVACAAALVWFAGWIEHYNVFAGWFPPLVAAVGAYWYRHRILSSLAGAYLLFCFSVLLASGKDGGDAWPVFLAAAGVCALSIGLAYPMSRHAGVSSLARPLEIFGLSGLFLLSYILAFHEPSRHLADWTPKQTWWWVSMALVWIPALYVWIRYRQVFRELGPSIGERAWIHAGVIILLTAGLLVQQGLILTIAANLAAVIIAAGLIQRGVLHFERRSFWLGVVLVLLLIISRFIEYDSHMLVLSAVLTGCGIVLILSGIRFEKYLRTRMG